MGFIPFAAFVIGFLETMVLFGLFWVVFRIFRGSPVVRNRVVYVVSYPGVFAAASGWIGFVVPIPAILGVPLVFLTGQLNGVGDAAWFPAPFLSAGLGFEGPQHTVAAFFFGEIALLIAWGVAVRLIHTRFASSPGNDRQ